MGERIRVRCVCIAQYVSFEGREPNPGPFLDLEVGAIYSAMPTRENGWWRVWDGSGEDYLYPDGYFELVTDET